MDESKGSMTAVPELFDVQDDRPTHVHMLKNEGLFQTIWKGSFEEK